MVTQREGGTPKNRDISERTKKVNYCAATLVKTNCFPVPDGDIPLCPLTYINIFLVPKLYKLFEVTHNAGNIQKREHHSVSFLPARDAKRPNPFYIPTMG